MDIKELGRIINSDNEIKAYIDSGNITGFNFIFGDEGFWKLYYANALAKKAVNSNFEDFNLHRFDGKSTTVDVIAEAVEAMPMFSDKTCVIVNDFPINDIDQTESEKLIAVLNDIPETCVMIMLMDTVERKIAKLKADVKDTFDSDVDPKIKSDEEMENCIEDKKNKKYIWDSILEIALKKGHVIELNRKTNYELKNILIRGAEKRGKIISDEASSYLITCVGNDLSNLQNELVKICLSTKNNVITKEEIDAIAIKSTEAKVFDMIKLIMLNDIHGAFSILAALFSQKVEPAQIFGAFITSFIDMYRVKLAVVSGSNSNDVARFFNYKNKEFRLKNAARDITGISSKKLRICLNFLDDADYQLKRRTIDPKLVFEQTIIRITKTINI